MSLGSHLEREESTTVIFCTRILYSVIVFPFIQYTVLLDDARSQILRSHGEALTIIIGIILFGSKFLIERSLTVYILVDAELEISDQGFVINSIIDSLEVH